MVYIGVETLLKVASLVQVLKYGDRPLTNVEIAETLQRARRVATSRKELAKLCQEAAIVLCEK